VLVYCDEDEEDGVGEKRLGDLERDEEDADGDDWMLACWILRTVEIGVVGECDTDDGEPPLLIVTFDCVWE